MVTALEENPKESRKEGLLSIMERAGKLKDNVSKYQFWQHNNNPIELWSTAVIRQS